MSKYVLVPDSFKGTMSSTQICSIMEKAILRIDPQAEVISIPVADGGEGSVDAFLTACGGRKQAVVVTDPFGDPMDCSYGITGDGTAVIEMAACAGLPLVYNRRDPSRATTYGVGEMMLHAAQNGCGRIIVCLGGSATNDGGCGAAAAAGVRFFDYTGKAFVPTGATLSSIASIDASGLSPVFKEKEILTLCDVDNPLCGENGAAQTFAPQKGANETMVALLDEGLAHLARLACAQEEEGLSPAMPSAGAAGGMGFGMRFFFHSPLRMGIDAMLELVGFDRILRDADVVFTGEGRIDPQSMHGKTAIGVARRAKAAGVPAIAMVGDIADGIETAYDLGVSAIFSINQVAIERKLAKLRAPRDLEATMENVVRVICSLRK